MVQFLKDFNIFGCSAQKKQNRATQASLTGFWSASAGEGLDQTGVHQKTQVSLFYIVIEFLMWMCGLNVSLAVFS